MAFIIRPGDLADAKVIALLTHHYASAHAETPKGSAHALDVQGLKSPDIAFFTAWENVTLVGVGALKTMSLDEGEVKSMHTLEAARGKGVGGTMLTHIIETARSKGMLRLKLETGSFAYFAPARALYRRHGFQDCDPFGTYQPDRNSVFMSLDLHQGR